MAVNKVEINGEVKLDLTGDTVTAATLQKGVTAHNKAGVKVTGTLVVPTQQTKTVELSMASGNQTISPDSGKVLSKVTINKPSTLIPANIKKDVVIGGVTGTLESGSGGSSETWVLQDVVNASQLLEYGNGPLYLSFVSNGVTYSKMWITDDGDSYTLCYDNTAVATGRTASFISEFVNEAYRKIIWLNPPDSESEEYEIKTSWFFLQLIGDTANAVKQPANVGIQTDKSITITSNGTTTITPNSPYDAMSKVDVVVNVAGSETATVTIVRNEYWNFPSTDTCRLYFALVSPDGVLQTKVLLSTQTYDSDVVFSVRKGSIVSVISFYGSLLSSAQSIEGGEFIDKYSGVYGGFFVAEDSCVITPESDM